MHACMHALLVRACVRACMHDVGGGAPCAGWVESEVHASRCRARQASMRHARMPGDETGGLCAECHYAHATVPWASAPPPPLPFLSHLPFLSLMHTQPAAHTASPTHHGHQLVQIIAVQHALHVAPRAYLCGVAQLRSTAAAGGASLRGQNARMRRVSCRPAVTAAEVVVVVLAGDIWAVKRHSRWRQAPGDPGRLGSLLDGEVDARAVYPSDLRLQSWTSAETNVPVLAHLVACGKWAL